MEKQQWWKRAVVYQVWPKSFCDSNGDGLGDLPGVTSRLDYLQQLGVDVVWLCPFYPSPGFDNGYDISDYEGVDPAFGSMEDLDELLAQAHARGMRVVADLVVNHSSDEHAWFVESRQSLQSPKRSYYIWQKGRGADGSEPPSNWGALFGGPAWTRDEESGEWYLHLFSPKQPDLNWEEPALRAEVYAMMRRWLERGIDGFRMDVISLISKPPSYPDAPVGPAGYGAWGPLVANGPRVHEFLREMRREALSGFDAMTVGEASGVTLEEAQRYANADGSELDMVFQFEHMDLDGGETFKWNDRRIEMPALRRVLDRWQLGMEGKGWNALFFNNHDQPRMLSRICREEGCREAAAKMLATCLHMMKGTPYIYQGEELGMTNMPFTSPQQLRDPESIDAYARYTGDGRFTGEEMLRYICLKSRDNARTPMQWSAAPGAGFTSGTPWMDINPNHVDINAAEQMARPDSVWHHYRALIGLRHSMKVVLEGVYKPFRPEDEQVYAYTRRTGRQALFVACNFTAAPAPFLPPGGFEKARLLLTNVQGSTYMKDHQLAPYEAVILHTEG